MFDEMMKHFGSSVLIIEGNWTYGDNLATVNRLTAGGAMPLDQASVHTPTGKYAAAWGYGKVTVQLQSIGLPGNYTNVYVLFAK